MRFKHRVVALCLSICLLAAPVVAGEAKKISGEDLLPDTTLLAVVIPNLSSAREAWSKTRVADMFAQAEMQEFLNPILEQLRKTHAELKAQNPMIPALGDLDKGIFAGELTVGLFLIPGPTEGFLLYFKPDDPTAFLNALKPLFNGQAPPENTPIPLAPTPEAGGMLWTQGRFLLGGPMAMLQDAAARIKSEPNAAAANNSLASNADYVAARKKLANALGWLYFRPAGIGEIRRGGAGRNAAEPVVEQALKNLGIQKDSSLLIGASVANGELVNEVVLSNLDRARGIGSLFGPQPAISAAALKIAAPDAPFVSAASFNFSAIIPLIRGVLADPADAKDFEGALAQANQFLTFDLQRDLLENLGSEMALAVTALDTALPLSFSPGMISSIALKNPAKVEECLKKIVSVVNAQRNPFGLLMQVKSFDHKAGKVYYYSGFSVCIAGERMYSANSLNAMRRGLDQLARNEDITSSKEFQETLSRLSGRPFDAKNLPSGFAFAKDESSGNGALLATLAGVTAGTAVLGALAEATFPPPPPPGVVGGDPMAEVRAFLSRPAGKVALAVLNSTDLGFWPDEGFFAKYRRAKGSVTLSDPGGILWRTELPPPMPGYKSGASILPLIAVTSIGAGLILPVLARARESARRTSSASNMNQVAKACYMYADVPANGDFPADPTKLFPNYVADPRVFKNPRFGDQGAGYIFVSGASINDDAATVLMYENVPEQQAAFGRNAVFTDGRVEFLEDATFNEMLKKTEASIKKRKGTMKLVPVDATQLKRQGQ